MPTKRPINAEDLYRLQTLSEPQISPDGRQILFCLEEVERESEEKYVNLWRMPADGGPARPLTHGQQRAALPRWSSDGQQIAFLSKEKKDGQSQIHLMAAGGGEARPLTDVRGKFKHLSWSPDGRFLLCQFRQKDAAELARENDARQKELGRVVRHISRLFYKEDGVGFLPQERWHLWLFDALDGQGRQLTSGPIFDERDPCWSPDGQQIVFVSNHSPDPDLGHGLDDLFVISAAGGEAQRIDCPAGPKSLPAFSPDGQTVAYIGREGRGRVWRNDGLWLVDVTGRQPARSITAGYDLQVGDGTLGDVSSRNTQRPLWSPVGSRVYYQVTRHGSTHLYRQEAAGGEPQAVIDQPGTVNDFSLDRSGRRLACLFGQLTDPGQIWLWELEEETFQPLTAVNGWLGEEIDLGQSEEIWFQGPDGNRLQGWVIKPPDFDPARQYPSILEVHGGPWLQYGHLFMHEFYYLAGQGYIVFLCNPRGGQGYGEAHSQAIDRQWGTADYADLMAWADQMAAEPYIDRERMGVAGGSYGGYMTGWIIGHTQRFRAAVAQRVVSNLVDFVGSSDFNWLFQEIWAGDEAPWDNLEIYWRQSPIAYIGQARTPTLVIHSAKDHRCPVSQGEQLFAALKKQGVPSELLLFPEESHGLSRSGRTDRRIVRLEHMAGWFRKYL